MEISYKDKIAHLRKQCAVVIRKPKLRIFNEYEALVNYIIDNPNATSTDWKTERDNYKKERENIFKDIIFKSGDTASRNRKILREVNEKDDYWYLVANGYIDIDSDSQIKTVTRQSYVAGTQPSDKSSIFSITSDVNNSVTSVTVEQTTETAWTSNITLDNTNDIYYLKNREIVDRYPKFIFQEGDCIIESNDEVDIYLTDWKGELYPVFTHGYVNSVTTSDNGLQKRIMLQCEDCTKKLSVSRLNVNPSLNPLESRGDEITPFTLSYALSTPEEVIKLMLGMTYCNVFADTTFVQSNISYIKTLRSETNTADRIKALETLKKSILQTIQDKYIVTDKDSSGKIKSVKGYEYLSDGQKRLKFIIEGINQDAWTIEFGQGGFDYLISTWKSNDEVINEIIKCIFFEFFADENGVIHVRPTNLTLPKHLVNGTANAITYNSRIDEYIISRDKELFVRSFNQTFNDRAVFTDIIVSGQYQMTGYTNPLMRKLVTAPYKYRKWFGTRMAPHETKIGAILDNQLQTYGTARLCRHNADMWNASLVMEGNSRINAGNPMYVERWQSVYYATNVTHSFTAGEDYTMTVNLNNRRKPIDYIEDGMDIRFMLGYDLISMVKRNEISNEEMQNILNNIETLKWGYVKIPEVVGGIEIKNSYKKYHIIWESIPTIFDPILLQNTSANAAIYSEKIKDAYKKWESAKAKNKDIVEYESNYKTILNQAQEIFGTDLVSSQFDPVRELVNKKKEKV
jgi:hypothetical protein